MRHDLESIGQALKAAVKMLWGMGDVAPGGLPSMSHPGEDQKHPAPSVGETDLPGKPARPDPGV